MGEPGREPGAEPVWLTDEQQDAWRQLAALMNRLPGALDAQLQRDAQLSHFGYFVLAMLSEAPGRSLRMSELAARSSSSLSRLSHSVSRLEQQGWVRRERAAEDGRGQVAVLTDAGLDKIVDTAPLHVAEVRRLVFAGLDDAQVQALAAIGRAVLARVDGGTC